MLKPIQLPDESATPYLTATNFVEAFNQEVRSLYLLSFLLTADHDKAEECLVLAIGECMEGSPVFTDRAHSWTRRAVMKHAIRMIMPEPEHAGDLSFASLACPVTTGENDP